MQIRYRALAATLVVVGVTAQPVSADTDISISIGIPAPVVALSAPPVMVWLPGPAIHIAYGSPYPIFFVGGHYYLHDHDHWYLGPGYGGPWQAVKAKHLPPGLRTFKGGDWQRYQREAQNHRHDKSRVFQAKSGHGQAKSGQARGHGPGHGKEKKHGRD